LIFVNLGYKLSLAQKEMSKDTALGSAVLFLAIFVNTDVCAVEFPERGNYIEVPPGTKLCDPAEDVYGFYLVKSQMNPNGTQEVEYYRFSTYSDPQTGTPTPKLQRSFMVWFKRHPQFKDKLQAIGALTGEPDEFPYAVCKK